MWHDEFFINPFVSHTLRPTVICTLQVGLATLVLTVLAPLGGAVSFKRLGMIYTFPESWHPRIKWLHRSVGVLVWLMAMTTIELALPHPAVTRVGHLGGVGDARVT